MLVGVRESLGLTQIDIAVRLGKPQSFVSKYERGERRLDLPEAIEVLRAIDVDPLEFLAEYLQRIAPVACSFQVTD